MALIMAILGSAAPLIARGQEETDQKAPAPASARTEPSPEAFPEQPDDGLLTLNAVMQMPDGSPAANAVIEHQEQWLPRRRNISRADFAGRATVRDVFGNGAMIHACSADGLFQATLRVDAQATRSEFAKPVVIKLHPCVTHRVIVESNGQPVSDVHVIASGFLFKIRGKTGPDGTVNLKLPADDDLKCIDAWDPDRAVAGIGDWVQPIKADSTRLSLPLGSPFLVRAVESDGKPAVGVDFGLDFQLENVGWIQTRYFPGAHVRTNEQGEASIAWLPKGRPLYADATIVGSNWAVEEIDAKEIANRIVTVHVRRQRLVQGRLKMPDGVSARGILIGANSFGPGHRGTDPSTRARADGTFELPAVSDFGFLIGTVDREWASEPWAGLIMAKDDDDPAVIDLSVQPATPIRIRVTQGPNDEPQPDAWIFLNDQQKAIRWIDSHGEQKSASGRIGSWLRTNSDGIATCGAAPGRINLRAVSNAWAEEKNLKIQPAEPIEVHFHQP